MSIAAGPTIIKRGKIYFLFFLVLKTGLKPNVCGGAKDSFEATKMSLLMVFEKIPPAALK